MTLRIVRDGYRAWWQCTCGWTTPMRDQQGQHIHGSAAKAIQHAANCKGQP